MTKGEIAKMIDHTNLGACATEDDIGKLCAEARRFGFASVCVNPSHVAFAHGVLKGSGVKVCTVIGFPLGADTIDNKAASAAVAVDEGADEIDMVQNLGYVKSGSWDDLREEINAVVCAAGSVAAEGRPRPVVKVILETCYLSDDEIVRCCRVAQEAGADFVKTSTGFAVVRGADGELLPNGATERAVALMRRTVGGALSVKASGGIRTFEDAVRMVRAGADRIGTSNGARIVG